MAIYNQTVPLKYYARWMEPKTGWLSGIALLLVVIQVIKQLKINNINLLN